MARNRFMYTEGGGMEEVDPISGDPVGGPPAAPAAPDAGAPAAPAAPAAPSADPGPGPNGNPAPQGGNPGPPTPPPPAVVSSIPGIAGSDTTGGVRGSFGQAGDAGFSKRFGQPAAWFRGGGQGVPSGLERAASMGRGILAKQNAGGGVGGGTVQNVASPSQGSEGGNPNDEEFQRMLRAVMAQRFGSGGRG